jgi:hypothetical protein
MWWPLLLSRKWPVSRLIMQMEGEVACYDVTSFSRLFTLSSFSPKVRDLAFLYTFYAAVWIQNGACDYVVILSILDSSGKS